MATVRTHRTELDHDRSGGWLSGGWGPVLSAATTAFLTFIALSALWLAIAGTGVEWVANNLAWFDVASALAAAGIGGIVAGRLQPGERGAGMIQGAAAWGLVLFAGTIIGVPSVSAVFSGASNLTLQTLAQGGNIANTLSQFGSELWAAFGVFAGGGLLAAMTGGAAAGTHTGHERHVETATARTEPRTAEREIDVRDESTLGTRR